MSSSMQIPGADTPPREPVRHPRRPWLPRPPVSRPNRPERHCFSFVDLGLRPPLASPRGKSCAPASGHGGCNQVQEAARRRPHVTACGRVSRDMPGATPHSYLTHSPPRDQRTRPLGCQRTDRRLPGPGSRRSFPIGPLSARARRCRRAVRTDKGPWSPADLVHFTAFLHVQQFVAGP